MMSDASVEDLFLHGVLADTSEHVFCMGNAWVVGLSFMFAMSALLSAADHECPALDGGPGVMGACEVGVGEVE